MKSFCGGGTDIDLICRSDKIVVPKVPQKYALNWYHTYLLYPGSDRTELTIRQHLYWENMQADIRAHVRTCDTCQKTKKYKKYGHLPEKTAEAVPWERLCIDLIGPYTIEREDIPIFQYQFITYCFRILGSSAQDTQAPVWRNTIFI